MTTVLKEDISQALGQALIDDVFLQKSRYFYTIGRCYPWGTNDFSPEEVQNTEKYQKAVRSNILYAKQIQGTSVSFVIPRYNYQQNVTYVKYDDAVSLEGQKFYVLSSDYNVYKCIDNNSSGVSTVEPYGTIPTPIKLSDGYTWQYIYSVPPSLRTKFLTTEFMPVFNSITERYYSRGSISSIKINSGGFGYVQSSTELVVSGDGYLADDPVKINTFVIGQNGSGYTSTPTVETSNQFNNFVNYSASLPLIQGQKIKVSDVAGVRFYEATTSGNLGTVAPTHYYSTETSGTVQLKHVGTKPKITATVLATAVGKIIVTESGFGYSSVPSVTKNSPGTGCVLSPVMNGDKIDTISVQSFGSGYNNQTVTISSPYPSSTAFPVTTAVSAGSVYYVVIGADTYFYRVDVAGTTSGSNPTHTTGTASNGTAMLTVVGKQAKATAILGIVDSVTKYFDIQDIKITNEGSGYVQGSTTISFTGGSPVIPATANVVVSGGKIISINVTFPGYGYQSAPSVVINGVGSSASATATMQCGYGYSLAPTLVFSTPNDTSGSQPLVFSTVTKTEAKLKPVIIDGILRGVVVVDGGIGYTQANIQVVGVGSGASLTPIFASSELNTIQAQTQLLATAGTVSSYTVENQGSNITSLSIQLIGDGTGATAVPYIDNGRLVKLEVGNVGQDYSYLDVVVSTNPEATPPVVRAILAPTNGHGSNPIKELQAKSVGLNVAIGNEVNNGFPINNTFRQISIIKSPLEYGKSKLVESQSASACIVVSANTTTVPLAKNIILQNGNYKYRVVDFTSSKILLQSVSTGEISSGDVLSFTINNIVYNIQVDSVVAPEMDKDSGEILYVDNQVPFSPSTNQTINVTTTISLS